MCFAHWLLSIYLCGISQKLPNLLFQSEKCLAFHQSGSAGFWKTCDRLVFFFSLFFLSSSPLWFACLKKDKAGYQELSLHRKSVMQIVSLHRQ